MSNNPFQTVTFKIASRTQPIAHPGIFVMGAVQMASNEGTLEQLSVPFLAPVTEISEIDTLGIVFRQAIEFDLPLLRTPEITIDLTPDIPPSTDNLAFESHKPNTPTGGPLKPEGDSVLNLSFLFGGLNKLSPINELIEISPLDALSVEDIEIAALDFPDVSSDEFLSFKAPATEDLSPWLASQFTQPAIESIALLGSPRQEGKSYGAILQSVESLTTREAGEECVHGLKKKSCSICQQREREAREKTVRPIDLFDLIFPILQPPLGENFDNPLLLPPNATLYEFQRTGIRFLAERDNALLGDEMGLGKSIQTIMAIRILFQQGKISKVLLICPKAVLGDWEKKLEDWAPELRVLKVRGTPEQREQYWKSPSHIHLTTYETVRDDLQYITLASQRRFDLGVLDEIQRIKNPTAGITKAVRTVNTRMRWGLSGTPLENKVEDLISIFAYIKAGLLREQDAGNVSKIKNDIAPYFLRRRKQELLATLNLPEKIHEEIWLELYPRQRKIYEYVEREGVAELNAKGEMVSRTHIFALITKLKQICNLDSISGESCKADYLLEELEEVTSQDFKALIFSQYPKKTLRVLKPRFEKFGPVIYDGSLSDSQRNDLVQKFQHGNEHHVLLMSVKSGGVGLTLHRANYVYHFDLWWNPSVAAQAEDRVHRIGQRNPVFVQTLFTRETIEERIKTILDKKRQLFADVIDDLSDTALEGILSDDELFGLFGLQKPTRIFPKQNNEFEPASFTIKDPTKLDAQKFEQLVGRLYEKMGYVVKVTSYSRDHGIDVEARRVAAGSKYEYLAIQCKHYPNRSVSEGTIRELYGVVQNDPKITKGILVTSGDISLPAQRYAYGKPLELINGDYLHGLLIKFNVRP
jgi:hypothetical protein